MRAARRRRRGPSRSMAIGFVRPRAPRPPPAGARVASARRIRMVRADPALIRVASGQSLASRIPGASCREWRRPIWPWPSLWKDWVERRKTLQRALPRWRQNRCAADPACLGAPGTSRRTESSSVSKCATTASAPRAPKLSRGDAIGRLRRPAAIEDGAQGDTGLQDQDRYEEPEREGVTAIGVVDALRENLVEHVITPT